jgi:ATP-binding cassette subfamily B protein
VLLILQAASVLAGPILVRYGIDHGVFPNRDRGVIDVAAGLFLVVAVAGFFIGRAVIRLVAWIGESFLRDLRTRVFRHLMGLSLDFYEREKTGVVVSRMTSDIDALQELVSQGLVLFVVNALLFGGAIVVLVAMSPVLAAFTLLLVPPVAWASSWFRRESNRAYLELRDAVGATLSSVQEGLSGVRVVQAFAQERTSVRRFAQANEAQYSAHLHTIAISAKYFPMIEFAGVAAMVVVLVAGGFMVRSDLVTVGTVAAFVLNLNHLFEPINQLSQLFNTLQAAGAALHKLFGLLDERPSVAERPGAVDLPARGVLSVEGASFAYERGGKVLSDVSLEVRPGERVALVGPTGAGKSTLAKLVARFYDPLEGSVAYAGLDLRDATLRSLRERIVVVPQEGFLFHGTIRENVLVGGPEAGDAEVLAAIERVGLTERFRAFPEGLDTEVRERGSRLSAGERQLVSLVRAALADPEVLVLDEATSNLDPGTELMVERALDVLMRGRTVVVIAHRLSTAARADRVVVVDEGRLVEEGTHEELLRRGGRYAQLFAAWSSGQEMAEPA